MWEPVLRKIVQVYNFTYSKIFFKTFGGAMVPPVTNIALPLAIRFSTNIRFYEYYRVGQSYAILELGQKDTN